MAEIRNPREPGSPLWPARSESLETERVQRIHIPRGTTRPGHARVPVCLDLDTDYCPGVGRVLRHCLTGALLWCLSSVVSAAQPIFDAHIHYSEDVWEALPPGRALQKLSEAGIRRAVISATPAEGAERLYRVAPARVVPFLRPYTSRAHRYTWHRDPAIPDWLRAQLGRIPYRGIGEFHVFGADATSPVVQETVDIARQRGLVLMAHTDPAGIAAILARAPDTDVIWAHAGFDVPLDELQSLLEAHPRLWLELSFREGMLEDGVLTPAWHRFLDAHADRCLAGTDTYTPGRWADLTGLVEETRQWLAQLPDAQASRIAHDNATRLFGPPGTPGTP